MKILVIEDERGSVYQAKQLLVGSDHPILKLEVVGELTTGLDRLKQGGVDAVLLDLNLPDSSGIETFRRVRTCAPHIPIVLLNDGQITQAAQEHNPNEHGAALNQALHMARERSRLMAGSAVRSPHRLGMDPYTPISELISDYAYSFHVDREGVAHIDWVTDSFQRITGYDAAELMEIGGWQALAHPDDLSIVETQSIKASQGEPNASEFRIITRQGETRWVHHQSQYIWDATEGRVAGFYGVGQNITERKKSEKLQQALLEISETANASRTLEELYAAIHTIINGLIPAQNFYIALYDP
ncbi:MAG TPA: PAS domain-containing protein, partial [Levilinea sp.]|nr:PAS domain-containing protein [Levilinea sp.]